MDESDRNLVWHLGAQGDLRGNFASLADLQRQLEAFVDYFNRTMAKSFKCTYQGKPSNSHYDSLCDLFLCKTTPILRKSQENTPKIDKKR